jgi:hypothetical protein
MNKSGKFPFKSKLESELDYMYILASYMGVVQKFLDYYAGSMCYGQDIQ